MTIIPEPTPEDDVIDKQERVEYVVDERIAAADVEEDEANALLFARLGTDVVVSPTSPSAGYVQAEAASMKTAVDAIIAALVESGILAEDV
jgi:hypothetical protein